MRRPEAAVPGALQAEKFRGWWAAWPNGSRLFGRHPVSKIGRQCYGGSAIGIDPWRIPLLLCLPVFALSALTLAIDGLWGGAGGRVRLLEPPLRFPHVVKAAFASLIRVDRTDVEAAYRAARGALAGA